MEINPKRIFSNEEVNLPNAKRNKAKEEDKKSAEKKSKAPNNPSYYSNYYGIHKVSFGQTPKTDSERLEYLRQMKTANGTPLFESSAFEPKITMSDFDEEEIKEDSSLVKLSKDEKKFEFFKTMSSLKYDNGESVYNEENIAQLVETAIAIDTSGEEEIDLYGMKCHLKFDDDFGDFIQKFINEKDKNGQYLFKQDNLVITLVVPYFFKPKDVSTEEMLNNFREIYSANENSGENKLSLNSIIELTIAKTADEECKGLDIKGNMSKIQEYCKDQTELGMPVIPATIAAKIVISDEATRKTFEKFTKYKKSSGETFFNGDDLLKLANKFKGDEKVFELTDKLIEAKNGDDENSSR